MRKHSVKKYLICFIPLVLLSAGIGGMLGFLVENHWLAWTLSAIQGFVIGILITVLYRSWLEKA